jgi:hypothetical protein
MVVEAGKLREFAAATGSSHPAYVCAHADSSPPTFLITKRLWQADDDPWADTGLDPARILHAGEEFAFTGPPPGPGTTLTFDSHIEKVFTKRGRRGGELTFAVLCTEYRDEAGALRATSRTTVVQPGQTPLEPR